MIGHACDHALVSLERVHDLAFNQIPKVNLIVLRARYDKGIVIGKARVDAVLGIEVTLVLGEQFAVASIKQTQSIVEARNQQTISIVRHGDRGDRLCGRVEKAQCPANDQNTSDRGNEI